MLEYSEQLRMMRETIEPIAASVYFAPETIQRLQALHLSPLEAYFCGRSAAMGRLTGPSVSSIFAFFNPKIAESSVESGWNKTDPPSVVDARLDAVASYMGRVILSEPTSDVKATIDLLSSVVDSVPDAGRPLFGAWRKIEIPNKDWRLRLWRACDLFREHRGAAHTAAWLVSGIAPREAVVLSKHWWGLQSNAYLAVHGWSETDISEAESVLESLGYLNESRVTQSGIELRDEIEDLTDRMQIDIVRALSGKFGQITQALTPFRDAVLQAGAYPMRQVPARK